MERDESERKNIRELNEGISIQELLQNIAMVKEIFKKDGVPISDKIEKLKKQIEENKKMRVLNLFNIDFEDVDYKILAEILNGPNRVYTIVFDQVNFKGNFFNIRNALINSNVRTLGFVNSNIDINKLFMLSDILTGTKVNNFQFYSAHYNASILQMIHLMLNQNVIIKSLSIGGNLTRDIALPFLIKLLQNNKTLESLYVSCNDLTDSDFKEIHEAARKNYVLVNINITPEKSNRENDEKLNLIAKRNTKLEKRYNVFIELLNYFNADLTKEILSYASDDFNILYKLNNAAKKIHNKEPINMLEFSAPEISGIHKIIKANYNNKINPVKTFDEGWKRTGDTLVKNARLRGKIFFNYKEKALKIIKKLNKKGYRVK